MPRKFLPSMFNKKVEFGTIQNVANDNTGDYDSKFVSQFNLWCYPQKRTLTQQYQLLGIQLEDTTVLIVRHNPSITKQLKVKYADRYYNILNISSDDSLNYMAYDYLTVKLINKVG